MLTLYLFCFQYFYRQTFSSLLPFYISSVGTVSLIRGGKGNNRFYSAKTFCPFFCCFFPTPNPWTKLPPKSSRPECRFTFPLSALFASFSMNPATVIAAAKVIGFLYPPKLFELFF